MTDRLCARHRPQAGNDPLVDAGPGHHGDGPLCGDMDAEVVVVGSGSTALSAASHPAQEHGIAAVVFQAGHDMMPSHGVLTPLRRIGQRLIYVWYHVRDERL